MQDTKDKIEAIKAQYPQGTRIRMIHMDDPQPIPQGTEGIVDFVDDGGMLHMIWGNGRGLAIDVQEDTFEVLNEEIKERVVYVDKKFSSVSAALRRNDAAFFIGELKDQHQGEDMSYHGSPFYETVTVIQGGNDVFHHTDYDTKYHPNKIEFEKAEDLQQLGNSVIECIRMEIEELEKQIQIKEQEIENVQNNSKVISQMLDEPSQVMEETTFTMQMK